jgi:ankyrin repeat protein
MDSFSTYKDLDREILLNLSDKELIKVCRLNQYLFKTVCDDNFFKRRLQLTYPDTLSLYDVKKYSNYKNFYLNMIFYISKMKEVYGYSYVSGNTIKQYETFKNTPKKINLVSGKLEIDLQELLYVSAHKGELNLVKYAISQGAKIHSDDEEALRSASLNGHLEVVKYLVSLGADIHVEGNEPLRLAKLKGHLELAEYLSAL